LLVLDELLGRGRNAPLPRTAKQLGAGLGDIRPAARKIRQQTKRISRRDGHVGAELRRKYQLGLVVDQAA